jgi:hypothetical protein
MAAFSIETDVREPLLSCNGPTAGLPQNFLLAHRKKRTSITIVYQLILATEFKGVNRPSRFAFQRYLSVRYQRFWGCETTCKYAKHMPSCAAFVGCRVDISRIAACPEKLSAL